MRRDTINLETREILEDVKVSEVSDTILHRRLPPGVNGIETWFYYEIGSTTSASGETHISTNKAVHLPDITEKVTRTMET